MENINKPSEAIKFDLDFDDDTDIMEKIEQLVSAPVSNSAQRARIKASQIKERAIEKNITHRFRFPKVQNHEYCDSCSEYGDLLNCDRCSASFHLQCHDPPLDEETVPKGQWLCWKCQGDPKIFNDLIVTVNGKDSKRGRPNKFSEVRVKRDPVPSKVVSVCMPHLKLLDAEPTNENEEPNDDLDEDPDPDLTIVTPAPSSSTYSTEVLAPPSPPPPLQPSSPPPPPSTNGISECILMLDPDLPPGSDVSGNNNNNNNNNLITLAKAMKFCNPIEFTVPKNFVQSYILPGTDKTTSGLDKYSCVRYKLDSNGSVPLPAMFCFTCGRTCRISPLIQCDYCPLLFHTECLNPPINSIPKELWMCPNHIQNFIDEQIGDKTTFTDKIAIYTKFNALGDLDQKSIQIDFLNMGNAKHPRFSRKIYHSISHTTKVPLSVKHMYDKRAIERRRRIMTAPCRRQTAEHDEWLVNMVSLQVDLAKRMQQQQRPTDRRVPAWPPSGKKSDDSATTNGDDDKPSASQNGFSPSNVRTDTTTTTTTTTTTPITTTSTGTPTTTTTPTTATTSTTTATSNGIPEDTPTSPHSPSAASPSYSPSSSSSSSPSSPSPFDSQHKGNHIDGHPPSCLDCLDINTIRLLASQRMKQLQPVYKLTSFPDEAIRDRRKAQAMLCSVDLPMNPILITDRSIKLGKGTDNDICLDNFGVCNNVSNLQAFIYYDQIEKNYELINYSEHGTMVDGVVYGLSNSSNIDMYEEFEGKDDITLLKESLKPREVPAYKEDEVKSTCKKGTMKGFDQTINLILDESHERVFNSESGVEQVVLGLYIIRGDNVAIIGEIDSNLDKRMELQSIMVDPLNNVVH